MPAITAAIVAAFGTSQAAAAAGVNEVEPDDTAGNRAQPAFDADGVRIGGFVVYPDVMLSANYESNIYASDTNIVSDLAVTVAPQIAITRNDPGSRYQVNAQAQFRRYLSNSSLNDEQYHLYGAGFRELNTRTIVSGSFNVSRLTAERGTYQNDLTIGGPLREFVLEGQIGVNQRFNRVRVEGTGHYNRARFSDVALGNGAFLDQSFRDQGTAGITAAMLYDMSPRFGLEARGSFDKLKYVDQRPAFNRDATSYSVTGGAHYELSQLLTIAGGIGLRDHNFQNPGFRSIRGVALYGKVRWYPTPLISLRFDLTQTTSSSAFDQVSAVSVTEGRSSFDYEYRRNVIISGNVSLSNDHYGEVSATSRRVSVGTQVAWKANKVVRITGTAGFESRSQAAAGFIPGYNSFRVGLSVTLTR